MASEIQGLPEADRKTKDGAGVGLARNSGLGTIDESIAVTVQSSGHFKRNV